MSFMHASVLALPQLSFMQYAIEPTHAVLCASGFSPLYGTGKISYSKLAVFQKSAQSHGPIKLNTQPCDLNL